MITVQMITVQHPGNEQNSPDSMNGYASVFDGSLLGSDPTKCIFFNHGWYEKYTAVMDGWRNLNPL